MGRATGINQQAAATPRGAQGAKLSREQLLERVRAIGFKHAYVVGGDPRDRILGKQSKDTDIAIAGHSAQEAMALAARHGKVSELLVAGQLRGFRLSARWTPPEGIEFAFAATERSTGAGRHDFAITAGADVSIEEDLLRRDFTCNAIAEDIYTGERIDPLGGEADLRAGILRTVSEHSFPEDPLRVLRGFARAAKDNLYPDECTLAQMKEWAADPKRYMRDHVEHLIANYVSADYEALRAQLAKDAAKAGEQLSGAQLDARAGERWAARVADPKHRELGILAANGLLDGHELDLAATKAWAKDAIDERSQRPVFEAATGYRWYGDVPLSPERVYDELGKLFSGDHAAEAMRLAQEVGALGHLCPEFEPLIGYEQRNGHHQLSGAEHSLMVLQRACEWNASRAVRFAAFAHDTGKAGDPQSGEEVAWGWAKLPGHKEPVALYRSALDELGAEQVVDGELHYYAKPPVKDDEKHELSPAGKSHEDISERLNRRWLKRLAADGDTVDHTCLLVREHMYGDDADFLTLRPQAQARRARRFLARVGRDHAEDLMLLRRCDRAGKRGELAPGWDAELSAFEAAVRSQGQAAVSVRELAVRGQDLIAEGLPPTALGRALSEMLDLAVEDDAFNTREQLLGYVRAHKERLIAADERKRAARAAELEAHRQALRDKAKAQRQARHGERMAELGISE